MHFSEQISEISNRLSISLRDTKLILDSYAKYVLYRSSNEYRTTVLGIADLINKRIDNDGKMRTLAYQSTEIAQELGISPVICWGVISEYRDMLIKGLDNGDHYTVFRVFTVRGIDGKYLFRGSVSLPEGVKVRLDPSLRYLRGVK